MTKEAKLTAAIRILPEWKGYDDEIKKLQQKIDSGLLDSDPAETLEPVVELKGKFCLNISSICSLCFIF